MIREAFLATDPHDGAAQQQRDQRVAELLANGYDCHCQTLHRILDGRPVYLLEAHRPEPADSPSRRPTIKRSPPRLRDETTGRRLPEFEVR